MKIKPAASFIAGVFAVSTAFGTASAADVTWSTKLNLKFVGLSLGSMSSTMKVTPSSYAVSGRAKASGVASLLSSTRAEFYSYGSLYNNRAVPSEHGLSYKSRKKSGSVKLTFASGNITGNVSAPKVVYKAGATPVVPAHLQAVLDPVSAIVFPVAPGDVGKGDKICNRTVPVFDGKARINLVSRFKKSSRAKVSGFSGEVFTCSLRYQPISGLRMFKDDIKFMKANRNIEITVARVGDTNVYTLFGFKVATRKGTASGYAESFKAG